MKPQPHEKDGLRYYFRGEDIETLTKEELVIALQIATKMNKELTEKAHEVWKSEMNPFRMKARKFLWQ